jgi:hypothetical protein
VPLFRQAGSGPKTTRPNDHRALLGNEELHAEGPYITLNVSLSVYLSYLLLTWAIEVPLACGVLLRSCGWRKTLGSALLASLITHPLLWFVWSQVVSPHRHYGWYVASGETLVVLLESVVYFCVALPHLGTQVSRRIRWAAGVSFVANAASWATGHILHSVGWLDSYVSVTSRLLRILLSVGWPNT